VIALYDPITPMIQLGMWVLGLIVAVSVALAWQARKRDAAKRPEEFGEDVHELADRLRAKRDGGTKPDA
jgi:hypothetical protein